MKSKLSFILISLLLLIIGSVATTFFDANHHDQNLTLIQLIIEQEELVYQIVHSASIFPYDRDPASLAREFENNLDYLRHGGQIAKDDGHVIDLERVENRQVLFRLEAVEKQWQSFLTLLTQPAPLEGGINRNQTEFAPQLMIESRILLDTLIDLGEEVQAQSEASTSRIQSFHVAILIVAVILLLFGLGITNQHIVQPLHKLTEAAKKIAQGEKPKLTHYEGEVKEIGQLLTAFELMQNEIEASQQNLQNQLARSAGELTSVFAISQEIVRQTNPSRVLEMVTTEARSLLKADAAHLCLIHSDRQGFYLASRNGSVIGGHRDQPINHNNPQHFEEPADREALTHACEDCQFVAATYKKFAAAPLVAGTEKLGALCAVRREDMPFTQNDSRYLTLLANSAAVAIANARLIKLNSESVREKAVLSERARISSELHDNLAQIISYANLKIEEIQDQEDPKAVVELRQELQPLKSALQEANTQLRVALHDLNQSASAEVKMSSLVDMLNEIIRAFERDSGIEVAFKKIGLVGKDMPSHVRQQIGHIVREAFTNIYRHANATSVLFEIKEDEEYIHFLIADDGIGFPPHKSNGGSHYGLSIMAERARRSGGSLEIESTPGKGTRVMFYYPNGSPYSKPGGTVA